MNSFNRRLFRSLLPYSMGRRTRLIVTLTLGLLIGIVWYCERQGTTP
jgi:hypothetical protein